MNRILTNFSLWLFTLTLFTVVLYYGKPFLIPLSFSILLAMLMAPVCRFFDVKGLSRAISCTLSILILVIVLAGLLAIIVAQIAEFSNDMDKIQQRFKELGANIQKTIEEKSGLASAKQDEILKNQAEEMKKSSGSGVGAVFGSIISIIGGTAITLVFTFLLLFHKEKYERFFLMLYKDKDENEVREVLNDISEVSQKYLTGRALSILILFVLYAIALLIIGVKNALLLSAIASMLTIVPYVGPIVGGLFPILTAIVTEDSTQSAIWVGAAIIFIQVIDNYFIEPYVIGGEVSLSALATIAAILAGGLIWGVAGMILFIPMLSIFKIIFDHVKQLKPYGFLIGDQGKSATSSLKDLFKK